VPSIVITLLTSVCVDTPGSPDAGGKRPLQAFNAARRDF